jgi:hypothetical protein
MQPPSDNPYKLYYSDFCLHSKKFLQQLCKTPFYDKFEKINVSAGTHMLPPYVQKVPTIEVPSSATALVGDQVFEWLEAKSAASGPKSGEIQPYMPDEMGYGMGDSYSYLDVDETEQPMEHGFAFVGRPDQAINTPAEEEFGEPRQKAAEVNSRTRPPMPQVPQMQPQAPMGRGPIIPQSGGGPMGKKNMKQAYEQLLARRQQDMPKHPPPQAAPQ